MRVPTHHPPLGTLDDAPRGVVGDNAAERAAMCRVDHDQAGLERIGYPAQPAPLRCLGGRDRPGLDAGLGELLLEQCLGLVVREASTSGAQAAGNRQPR